MPKQTVVIVMCLENTPNGSQNWFDEVFSNDYLANEYMEKSKTPHKYFYSLHAKIDRQFALDNLDEQ